VTERRIIDDRASTKISLTLPTAWTAYHEKQTFSLSRLRALSTADQNKGKNLSLPVRGGARQEGKEKKATPARPKRRNNWHRPKPGERGEFPLPQRYLWDAKKSQSRRVDSKGGESLPLVTNRQTRIGEGKGGGRGLLTYKQSLIERLGINKETIYRCDCWKKIEVADQKTNLSLCWRKEKKYVGGGESPRAFKLLLVWFNICKRGRLG